MHPQWGAAFSLTDTSPTSRPAVKLSGKKKQPHHTPNGPLQNNVTLKVIIMIHLLITGRNMKMQNFARQNFEYEIDLSGGLLGAIQLYFCCAAGNGGSRWIHNTQWNSRRLLLLIKKVNKSSSVKRKVISSKTNRLWNNVLMQSCHLLVVVRIVSSWRISFVESERAFIVFPALGSSPSTIYIFFPHCFLSFIPVFAQVCHWNSAYSYLKIIIHIHGRNKLLLYFYLIKDQDALMV